MGELKVYEGTGANYYLSKDTITTGRIDSIKMEAMQKEVFLIPARLMNTPINFRINSSICYLNFKHFVGNESKKLFFQAWMKEQELQKLSVLTDSLRKMYSTASSEQKDMIASQIIKAEEKSIAINAEIPEMYQKAREKEDRYWQTASPYQMDQFQKKISLYNDSIKQLADVKAPQEITFTELPDTIILYKPSPKAEEKKAVPTTSGIIYKIQIGAYKGKIPESANKLIKKISAIRKVENYADDKGIKIYTTGNLRLYSEAVTMLGQVKQEGIKTPVINAYQNGKKITVTEARKLNNEL